VAYPVECDYFAYQAVETEVVVVVEGVVGGLKDMFELVHSLVVPVDKQVHVWESEPQYLAWTWVACPVECGFAAYQAVETEVVVVVVEGVGTPEFEALVHSLLVAAVDKRVHVWESEPQVLQNSASPVECDCFESQVVET